MTSRTHTHHQTIRNILLAYPLALIILLNTALAQTKTQPTHPHTLIIQQSIALMEQAKWQQTLDILNPLITQNKDSGIKKHGAKFATTHYYKGLCLLKLAQAANKQQAPSLYQAAIKSFTQCHTVNPPNDPSNTYRVKSLLLRANAQQALGQYQLAIHSYRLFLHQRNKTLDPYNLSDFNINLAICLWKNPPTPQNPKEAQQAIKLIQQSLLYSGRNKPSPHATITALRTLTDISISTQNDTLIPSTINQTLTSIPANLTLPQDPETSTQLLTTLSNLILTTAQKNLPLTSLHLTALIPDIQLYATALELPSTLTNNPTHLNLDQNQNLKNATLIALQARAISYQNTNHLKKALTLYTLILDKFPDTPTPAQQPNNLYNLARIAAQAGATDTAITKARQFLETYPDHPLHTPTLTILLNSLYHSQQYQQALTLASQILTTTKPQPHSPSTQALLQAATFIQPASHYYLGDYTLASTLLSPLQEHPENPYHTDATYLYAAAQNQLLHWDTSIPLLRKFITLHTNPDTPKNTSIYTPFAYYQIAYAHYSQNQPHSAILTLLPFTLNIPFADTFNKHTLTTSQISPSAAILLANTHLTLNLPESRNTAVSLYQTAIKLASENHNTQARDEAYYLITNLLGKPLWDGLTNHRLKETIPHYLNFTALPDAQNSPYYTQILTASITALEKSDTSEPVHLLLRDNLFTHNNQPNTPGIETALQTYLYYLRKNNLTTTEIIRTLTERINTTPSAYHQALIITAQLETLQHNQKHTPNQQTKDHINLLYQDLISQYRTQDLDNFTTLKIANHLATTNNLTQATTYYNSIINSTSNIKKIEAQLGLAILLANPKNTPSPKQLTNAKQQLTTILNNPFTPPAPRASAHYHLIQLLTHSQPQDWPQIQTHALTYLTYPLSVKTHNQKIQQTLALAYDKQQKTNLAISAYTHTWVTSFFSIQHSAPALHRACQLLWERNNPPHPAINQGKSDRQLAYETAYKYIRKTKDHLDQRRDSLPQAAIHTWQTIKQNATKNYPQDPTIKPFQGQP